MGQLASTQQRPIQKKSPLGSNDIQNQANLSKRSLSASQAHLNLIYQTCGLSHRNCLSETDLKLLSVETNLPTIEIKRAFDKFSQQNENGLLNKENFIDLYNQFKVEEEDKIKTNEIIDIIFKLFDVNNDGYLTFQEFIVRNLN
jgi:Ca2+-binding EF-hand superfamily protein